MRKSLVLLGAAAVAALLVTSAFAENRGVSFTGIGFLDPVPANRASMVLTMNPEGTVFVAAPNSVGSAAVYWTPEGGWGEIVGAIGFPPRLSSGGTLMSNGIYPGSSPAYLWPGTWTGSLNTWDPIPEPPGYVGCGNSRLSFYDMGGEGDYATGLTWQGCAIAHAYKWDKAAGTTVDLGTPNGRNTRGNGITADGSRVVGYGTMAQGLRRAVEFENGTVSFVGDPNGTEPKICSQSGAVCTFNGSGSNGCPEFVDDGSCTNRGTCQNRGTCVSSVCVGGSNPGASCTSNSQCRGTCTGGTNPGTQCTSDSVCAGTCTGPNAGATCTSNSTCPDTLVCINNPAWNAGLFKGEAYDVTADGQYAVGRQNCYPDGSCPSNSGWRSNPDGSFSEIEPPENFPNLVDPFAISDDGKTVAVRAGTFFTGVIPIFWHEGIGTQDMQLFLIAQGLDELFFWRLAQNSTVSADGTIIGGYGVNPDGKIEGYIVDLSKLWVCHAPPGQPEDARTLGIELGSAADHVAHGDFLGTCEFVNSGALSRAIDSVQELRETYKNVGFNPYEDTTVRRMPTGQRLKALPERKARREQ